MKKILATVILALGLASCSVFTSIGSSPYTDDVAYWSVKLTQTAYDLSQEGIKLVNATKAGKTDSAIIYAFNVNTLVFQELRYKDSLIYYINKLDDKDTAQ